MTYEITVTGDGKPQTFKVEFARDRNGALLCKVDGADVPLDALSSERDILSLLIGGRSYELRRDTDKVAVDGAVYTTEVRDPRSLRGRRSAADSADGPKKITAPMPGKVVRIIAPEGTEVDAGAGVVVIEAMKMQNEMKSPKKGIVKKISAAEGATVNAGDTLAVIE
jgi:biotin carboxyl carrier protein